MNSFVITNLPIKIKTLTLKAISLSNTTKNKKKTLINPHPKSQF